MIPRWFLLLLFLVPLVQSAQQHCYSCAGRCHSDHCNCQMGSCPSSHCFIERSPTEEAGVYKITKGCLRRPSRTINGCDYDHFSDHVQCVCTGNFCNDHIYLNRRYDRKNVTCRKCGERNPDCGETCNGQWCHEDSATGAAGCGFGPPSLPFFYKGPELLYFRHKMCVTMSRGLGPPRKHCICNTNWCNGFRKVGESAGVKSRSLINTPEPVMPLQECISCEATYSDDQANTMACKQHRCTGHFCVITGQRVSTGGSAIVGNAVNNKHVPGMVTERQGCINVTDSNQIQLGCAHKWMDGNFEEIRCACKGNLCNRDFLTATSTTVLPHVIFTLLAVLWNLVL
ncbi:hypothetical protein PRIPAC_74537 [Pristionchus pacificus]|uniref:Uncharacterized protein n=1 Tax=Pristionchus pacificus TaxID=54126 RepID=A0A2A6BRQ6_PRIPA|nr:hypothetical protein PRIPAC_74537 [Pristionchus pacificus]|eukprot:PDM68557.1 hypothetical protein PRIPAC_44059 [Pristionchus pacificus]